LILTTRAQIKSIDSLFYESKQFELLYRGTVDGFSGRKMLDKMANQGENFFVV
jgi:hypothetical protein